MKIQKCIRIDCFLKWLRKQGFRIEKNVYDETNNNFRGMMIMYEAKSAYLHFSLKDKETIIIDISFHWHINTLARRKGTKEDTLKAALEKECKME